MSGGLKLDNADRPGYLRAGNCIGSAIVLAAGVTEVVAEKMYGDERALFRKFSVFKNLKEKRDAVAHLNDFFVMDVGQVLDVVEALVPDLKAYLKKYDFWDGEGAN